MLMYIYGGINALLTQNGLSGASKLDKADIKTSSPPKSLDFALDFGRNTLSQATGAIESPFLYSLHLPQSREYSQH